MDADRPVVRCIVAWWSNKRVATPVVRPRGIDTKQAESGRVVKGAAMTLEEAAPFAELGFDVIVDPFDMEDLIRWEQTQRAARTPKRWNQWG